MNWLTIQKTWRTNKVDISVPLWLSKFKIEQRLEAHVASRDCLSPFWKILATSLGYIMTRISYDMMLIDALHNIHTLSLHFFFKVLGYWNNKPLVNILLLLEIIYWFRTNYYINIVHRIMLENRTFLEICAPTYFYLLNAIMLPLRNDIRYWVVLNVACREQVFIKLNPLPITLAATIWLKYYWRWR